MNKAELRRLANDVRGELGLTSTQRFDPLHWGKEWGVRMLSLDQVTSDPATLQRLTEDAPELWSAAVVKDRFGHFVIYNHAHSAPRIRSDLAHEVAHLVAEHRLDVAWMEPGGKNAGRLPPTRKKRPNSAVPFWSPLLKRRRTPSTDGPQKLSPRNLVSVWKWPRGV